MKNGLTKFLAATLLTLSVANASPGYYLGSASLTDSKDTDVIYLPPCHFTGNRPVSSLKLEVKNFDAEIDKLKITFQNGEKQELEVREHIPAGGESRWIDLRGAQRCIAKIVITGDADTFGNNNFKQSKILFFGM